MAPSKPRRPSVSAINEPPFQRPETLFQRISSGIVHALPPFRASSPTTLPSPSSEHIQTVAAAAECEQLLVPDTVKDSAAKFTQSCSYHPDTYHSFASIEKRRCSLCGMRGPKIVLNEPRDACNTGGGGSHRSSWDKQVDTYRQHSMIGARQLPHLDDSSSSVLLRPRPVTPGRAAKRIGNPPRVSKLPPGIIRLPVADISHNNAPSRSPPRASTGSPDDTGSLRSVGDSSRSEPLQKAFSPRIHHIHGLQNSEKFPFVHEREVSKHAVALRAGFTSPLTDRSPSPRMPSVNGGVTASQTQVTTVMVKEFHASGTPVIDLHTSPLDTVLADTKAYRKRSPPQVVPVEPDQASPDVTDSNTTFGSQNTRSTRLGDIRLELKGGQPAVDRSPRLRGGSGYERSSTNTLSFKLKRWLLTCHGPCPDDFDTDSDADLPPPTVVSPERVAKLQKRRNGRAPLPPHLRKGLQVTPISSNDRPGPEGLPPLTNFTTTVSGPAPSPRSSLLSPRLPTLFHRRRRPTPINQSANPTPSQVLDPPFPHLRGGAGSPDTVPPTLFWLAGGTGRKPITFDGWKQSRPKQRMGGLIGMAVFGNKYGKEYSVEVCTEEEGSISCSASIKVVVEDAKGVKEAHADTDRALSTVGSIRDATVDAGSTKGFTADVAEVAPGSSAEPAHRTLTPPPTKHVDGVPFCSGALPVEPTVDTDGDAPAYVTRGSDSEARDGAAEVEKNTS